jgi:glycosyltransferase involved in cell wall biosynthesis
MSIAKALDTGSRTVDGCLREIVVCSLEAWDDVWRRNQLLTDALVRHWSGLRVLFVEPPADVIFELTQGRRPVGPRLTSSRADGRLHRLRPLKPLPRRLGPLSDQWLNRRVIDAARRLGLTHPTLWLNDITYAPLISRTGWPTVYDVTDDWLLAPASSREIDRLRRLDAIALAQADEVVVCSPALAASRGKDRSVTLVPNGVDTEHFRRPRQRPGDMPAAQTAVYVGTLNEARLDIGLVAELARTLPSLSLVLVGPDALTKASRRALSAESNIYLLGARPYLDVPAYLQHADVVVVPHRLTPFTETLDPIKAYESLAVQTPTVATPVAGFRELAGRVTVASRESFVAAVQAVLSTSSPQLDAEGPPTWALRAQAFARVLIRASRGTASASGAECV